ncbi:hypothetical protein ACW9HR_19150 [Nocardia gipuzkoensis]|uniref:hypothetical protein n=1 Tax=Nocardia TaxID=1817 RepID=UPI001359AFFD|nr:MULTISPECIES: hypothetical protein [Nocardia]
MYSTSTSAVVAAALHRVFACSPHAADSLELWLAVTAEATRRLTTPAEPAASQWLPVFTAYRTQRTDAEYHTGTAAVRITTGPLSGITYTDADSAARAVVTAYPTPAPDIDVDGDEDGDDVVESLTLVPTWRLRVTYDPAPNAQPAATPMNG